MKKSQGFTLIELLVVVAIIGILATVVLASLGQARTRAKDAAIKSAISQARAEIELYMIDNGTYHGGSGTACAASISAFNTSITDNGGTSVACDAGASTYSYHAVLNDGSTIFCADHNGYAGEASAASATGCTPA